MSSSHRAARTAAKPDQAETPSHERPDNSASNSVAELKAELIEAKDRLLRALAEQENIRRTAKRERDEAVKFAAAGFAEDLLETADNLERAIASIPAERLSDEIIMRYLAGVLATERGLLQAFKKHGIERLDPTGEPFDPNRDHAIYEQIHPTAQEGSVLEVKQPGYRHHNRLLRPAAVIVARRPAASDEFGSEDTN